MASSGIPTRKFTRTKEDFICEQCGAVVTGNGYTNHCPKCLWSKHVDVNPGDRRETCGGMMEPVRVEQKRDIFRIAHRCVLCGRERKNRAMEDDRFDELVRVSAKATDSAL